MKVLMRYYRLIVFVAGLSALLGGLAPACIHPPPSIVTPAGQRAYTADQLVKDLTALSQTAINLNATTGREHLSDQDTRYVRDFALSAGAAATSYARGQGTLQVVILGVQTLMVQLSADAKTNPTFSKALVIVSAGVNALVANGGR
jgi:hypothetical protein